MVCFPQQSHVSPAQRRHIVLLQATAFARMINVSREQAACDSWKLLLDLMFEEA